MTISKDYDTTAVRPITSPFDFAFAKSSKGLMITFTSSLNFAYSKIVNGSHDK